MRRAILGKTGLSVGRLALGTAKFGRDQAVKYPEPFVIPDDRAAAALLDRAESLGINLLDTAPAYAASEERLGKLLAGRAHDWLVSTKVGEEFEGGRSTFDFSPRAVRRSVERSLTRLGRSALDIVLIHSDGRDEQSLAALPTLRELQREGKVRAVGASTKTPEGALLAVQSCDVVMLTLNAANQGDVPAIRLAARLGVGVLIKKPLDSGHAARVASDNPVRDAFRAVFAEPGVAAAVLGTINPDHLAHAAAEVEAALAERETPSLTSANRR